MQGYPEKAREGPGGLEAILAHAGRLDVLCCILDGGPLTVMQIGARTGEPERLVSHWLELLDAFGLVERIGAPGGGEPLYAATLDEHPEWVRERVRRHQQG